MRTPRVFVCDVVRRSGLATYTVTMSKALRQALEDWHRAGVTSLPPAAEPLDFSSILARLGDEGADADDRVPQKVEDTSARAPVGEVGEAGSINSPPESPRIAETAPSHTGSSAEQLAVLAERVRACQKCEQLAAQRTQTVFGVGNPDAQIMFVGEAPGADEDRIGEPFVGKAGQLLDRIIDACGWRREDLYICNILRCRPPGNRNPSDTEAANCREYLDGQIAAVQPQWIVCWGSVAAKNLLNVDKPIGRMRKQLFDYDGARVLCTYHPSYLLRNPSAKKDVWSDLQFLFGEMGHQPPRRSS